MNDSSARPADDIETIIERYGDMLYRLCILMLKNESDAEDVVQETVIKYYRKVHIIWFYIFLCRIQLQSRNAFLAHCGRARRLAFG